MQTSRLALLGAAVGLVVAVAASAADNPYTAPDRSWVSLTGRVAETKVEAFTLDYGGGAILVEMDDWDAADEARGLAAGERVTVYGRVDDGFYERRSIEANSVYSYDRRTYFYADDADEEGDHFGLPFAMTAMPDGSWISLSGTVDEVTGREFILDTGASTVTVDTAGMPYDPLDDEGVQQIAPGDRVTVWGVLDLDVFEKREVQAATIVNVTGGAQRTARAY